MNLQIIEEFALRFTHAAVHFLWLGSFLAVLVYVVDRMIVRSATGRHVLYLAGVLAMALALPVCYTFLDGDRREGIAAAGSPSTAVTNGVDPVGNETPMGLVESPVPAGHPGREIKVNCG